MRGNLEEQLKQAIREDRKWFFYPIYKVNDDVVAKMFAKKKLADNEYNMNIFLQENKINVPEVYDYLFYDKPVMKALRADKAVPAWFILMQKIKGREIWEFEGELHKEAGEKYRAELKKIVDLGIYPEDAHWHGNSIFNLEERKVYFIDFEYWRKAKPYEMKHLYKMVMNENLPV